MGARQKSSEVRRAAVFAFKTPLLQGSALIIVGQRSGLAAQSLAWFSVRLVGCFSQPVSVVFSLRARLGASLESTVSQLGNDIFCVPASGQLAHEPIQS